MRNRLFLLVLLAALIIIQAVLRTATMATPFSGGSTLAGYSFWELRSSLPMGVFSAGCLLFLSAAAAQCAQAALQLCRKGDRSLSRKLGSIVSAGLWCGAPCMASCYNALTCIFPWISTCNPQAWHTPQLFEWLLHGSIIALVLCRALTLSRHPASAWITLPLSLFCLLICGQAWFSLAFILLPIGLMGAGGAAMLLGRGRRWAILPLLTAFAMNQLLFLLGASNQFPQSTPPILTQAVWCIYACTLLLLVPAWCLKVASLLPQSSKKAV